MHFAIHKKSSDDYHSPLGFSLYFWDENWAKLKEFSNFSLF